jgi:serine/threonine protein kinase
LGPVVGTGSFGRVHVAHHIATGQVCATKSLSKAAIVKTKQARRALLLHQVFLHVPNYLLPPIINFHGEMFFFNYSKIIIIDVIM